MIHAPIAIEMIIIAILGLLKIFKKSDHDFKFMKWLYTEYLGQFFWFELRVSWEIENIIM